MRKTLIAGVALASGLTAGMVGLGSAAGADDHLGDPNKVWLCHYEDSNHDAPQVNGAYSRDDNGTAPGFWTTDPAWWTTGGEYLDGDYIVKWNDTESGLNSGQVALCNQTGGTFQLVSVNSISSFEETPRGHRAQNVDAIKTYPDGYKG